MTILRSRFAAALAVASALSLATPATARDWHRGRGDGIDGGDIFAGLLVIGGIAAIAAAASKSKRDREAREDERYRDDYRPDDYRSEDYREPAPVQGYGDDRSAPADEAPPAAARSDYGVDTAVDACVDEVERGDRVVQSIDGINREADGWRVGGRVSGGYGFSCVIGKDGRVKSVDGL